MSKIQNPFLAPSARVRLAAGDVARRVRWGGLITRMGGETFVGSIDETGRGVAYYETEAVTVARDYEWRTRNKPVQFDDIFRSKLPIYIDQHMTQGVRWTPEQDYFDEVRYLSDILPPSTQALARRLDSKIVGGILGSDSSLKVTDLVLGASGDAAGEGLLGQALAIKARCDAIGMPEDGRKLVVGANAFAWIMQSSSLQRYDIAQALTAFRRGIFGEIVGMEVVDGTTILGANEFRVIHPTWAVMPTASGDLPDDGVTWAAKGAVDGWDFRLVKGYSIDYDRNASVLHTYWGFNSLNDEIERHTRASAEALGDGSVAGDPKIENDKLKLTGKNVRHAKGTFVPA